MPFPSTGCQPCRTRRLKCDEAQPVCRRCAKSRRDCIGARPAQAGFISENQYASGQRKRPRGPRSAPTSVTVNSLHVMVPRQPFDLQTEAVLYFVHCHLQRLGDVPPLLSARDDLIVSQTRSACQLVDLGISSLALAIFSKTKQYPPAAIQASKNYQQLLKTLQPALTSLDSKNIEDCLLATSCMSLYESCVYQPHLQPDVPFLTRIRNQPHEVGTLAILKFWQENFSAEQPATDIIKHARRATMKNALIRGRALPRWMREGSSYGERGLELEYDEIMTRLLSARQRLSALRKYNCSRRPHRKDLEILAEPLITEARGIDLALQEWTSHFPKTWAPCPILLPSDRVWPSNCFYSPVVNSHESVVPAAVWIRYYSSRMLILSTRLSLLQLCEPDWESIFEEQERLECSFQLNNMTDELASTIPFSLQRFTLTKSFGSDSTDDAITLNTDDNVRPYLAGLTINPLMIGAAIGHIDVDQRSWFRTQLVQLGRITGYGIFEAATKDLWLEL